MRPWCSSFPDTQSVRVHTWIVLTKDFWSHPRIERVLGPYGQSPNPIRTFTPIVCNNDKTGPGETSQSHGYGRRCSSSTIVEGRRRKRSPKDSRILSVEWIFIDSLRYKRGTPVGSRLLTGHSFCFFNWEKRGQPGWDTIVRTRSRGTPWIRPEVDSGVVTNRGVVTGQDEGNKGNRSLENESFSEPVLGNGVRDEDLLDWLLYKNILQLWVTKLGN